MQKLKAITIVSLFIFSLLFVVFNVNEVHAVGTTRYVATTGDDATGDGSIGNPWKSIRKANNMSVAGDVIYVRGGTYLFNGGNKTIINKNGTATDWITYMPYPGENVVLDGMGLPSADLNAVVVIRYASYIRFSGFKIYNATRAGVHVQYKANHIRIDNCSFWNISESAIAAGGEGSGLPVENISVEYNHLNWTENNWAGTAGDETISFGGISIKNCYIHHNTLRLSCKENIDVKNGVSYVYIHNNTINTTNPVKMVCGPTYYGGIGIYCDGYSKKNNYIYIYNNMIWGNNTGINIGAELTSGSSQNISVYNNIINITNTPGHGIDLIDSGGKSLLKNVDIYSNTIYMGSTSDGHCFKTSQYKEYDVNVRIFNNIFTYANPSGGWRNILRFVQINSTDATRPTLSNNLYYSFGGTTHITWKDADDTGWGANYIKADPLFANRLIGNFHLNSTSPAIDKANSTYTVSTDYGSDIRPRGYGYDIGAYEYASPLVITITSDSNFNINHGVRYGTGTAASPYVICNWTIYNASISSTTKNLTIKNCTILHHALISGLSANSNVLFDTVIMDGVGHIPLSYIYLTHTQTTFTKSKFYNLSYSYMKNG